jgi:hypothetical protein
MALAAYELARPLDADGFFHLSVLQREARDYQGALSTALEGLRENPDHLLNLAAAAEAALRGGDREVAGGYYSRIRESWERERVAGRPEYQEHSSLLPLIREDAERFLEDDAP